MTAREMIELGNNTERKYNVTKTQETIEYLLGYKVNVGNIFKYKVV